MSTTAMFTNIITVPQINSVPVPETSTSSVPQLFSKQKGNIIPPGAKKGDGLQIAQGAVKTIYKWIDQDESGVLKLDPERVLYVANSFLGSRELDGEVEKAKDIEAALKKLGYDDSTETHIQTDMQKRSDGMGVDAPAAIGDLENIIKDPKLTLETRLDLAFQVLKGMHNMQKAGYVTGDAKLENILVFKGKDGRLIARISDFGKARKLGETEVSLVDGNPRFTAPEGALSRKGEVFSTALMVLRILEEGLDPKRCKKLAVTINDKERRGVEGLLISNGRSNKKGVLGQLAFVGTYIAAKTTGKASIDKPKQEQGVLAEHIDSLASKCFNEKFKDSPSDKMFLGIFALLKDMTRADPNKRPSMKAVESRFEEALDMLAETD